MILPSPCSEGEQDPAHPGLAQDCLAQALSEDMCLQCPHSAVGAARRLLSFLCTELWAFTQSTHLNVGLPWSPFPTQSANNSWALPCARIQAPASQPWGRHTPNPQTARPLEGSRLETARKGCIEAHVHSSQHHPPPQCACLCHLLVLGSPIASPRLSVPIFKVGVLLVYSYFKFLT